MDTDVIYAERYLIKRSKKITFKLSRVRHHSCFVSALIPAILDKIIGTLENIHR